MEAAARLAMRLLSHNVGAEIVIMLQLHRSLEQAVGMLGVLRSNGAYLPLDPIWPFDRRCHIFIDVASGQSVVQLVHATVCSHSFHGVVMMLDDPLVLIAI